MTPYLTSPYELTMMWFGIMTVVGCWAFAAIKIVELMS